MAEGDKIKSLFQRANRIATQQDPDVRAKILGNLALKAADDPAFLAALRKNPTLVAEKEASISNLQVSPADLKDVGEKARVLASRAVPDAGGAEVKEMVFRTIHDIETSFRLTLTLAKVLFFTGLGMVVASFVIVALYKDKQTAAIFGVGGILSLVLGTVMNTLDRVRDAAANLVQIQMAYLAYYKILHLLGPATEHASREDAVAYSKELTANVDKIMESLQGILRATKERGTPKKGERETEKDKDKRKPKGKENSKLAKSKKQPESPEGLD